MTMPISNPKPNPKPVTGPIYKEYEFAGAAAAVLTTKREDIGFGQTEYWGAKSTHQQWVYAIQEASVFLDVTPMRQAWRPGPDEEPIEDDSEFSVVLPDVFNCKLNTEDGEDILSFTMRKQGDTFLADGKLLQEYEVEI